MENVNFHSIGNITKTLDHNGGLMFFFNVENIRDYEALSYLFIEIDGNYIPFFIEEFHIKSPKKATVKLENVDNAAKAEKYTGLRVFLPRDLLAPAEKAKNRQQQFTGYTVIDKNYGNIGVVSEYIDKDIQPLIVVTSGDNEIFIPFHEDLITGTDEENRRLYIEVPEGLIDLNDKNDS